MLPANLLISRCDIINAIGRLPNNWHDSGTVTVGVLNAIAKQCEGRSIKHSVETGSGRTTLLLSHISEDHTVFAIDDRNSISQVKASPLFNSSKVRYVEGPTQLTLAKHEFKHPLQLVLLDGPHAYPFPELEYYHLYPHLAPGALFILDDIHIPTTRHLYSFLCEDEMFELLTVIDTTAFFRRTIAPLFNPIGDSWRKQRFNARRFPVESLSRKVNRVSRDFARQMRRTWRAAFARP